MCCLRVCTDDGRDRTDKGKKVDGRQHVKKEDEMKRKEAGLCSCRPEKKEKSKERETGG